MDLLSTVKTAISELLNTEAQNAEQLEIKRQQEKNAFDKEVTKILDGGTSKNIDALKAAQKELEKREKLQAIELLKDKATETTELLFGFIKDYLDEFESLTKKKDTILALFEKAEQQSQKLFSNYATNAYGEIPYNQSQNYASNRMFFKNLFLGVNENAATNLRNFINSENIITAVTKRFKIQV